MLIDFSVQNFGSFNSTQELSMLSSSTTHETCDLNNIYKVDLFGIKNILQSAAIFGPNGSGKTNFVDSLRIFKTLVLDSLDSVSDKSIDLIIPFFLKENDYDIPTEFEVSFLVDENLYRYGISLSEGEIIEEWLYWTKTSRETMLFHRHKQRVNYNQRSFSEAKLFVKKEKEDDSWSLEKTKAHIPFISVLSRFDGERSSVVTNWFSQLNIISGIQENGFKEFTTDLFESDPSFKSWALEILKSLQIEDLNILERELPFPTTRKSSKNEELNEAFSTIKGYFEKNNIKEKTIEIVKSNEDGETYDIPLVFESEGTRKLIYLLGPLYDVITNNEILVVDEFDNKFHTLLSKFIIELYNKHNVGRSQLILTCHDTNLLTNELFRRDQIWFIEKNKRHESEIFSLVEYKEHYTRKDKSYSKDYLLGKYGAIPLFSSLSEMESLINGQ